MTVKNICFMLLSILFLGACSSKNYTKQESVFIVFKTPTFKHADLGFFYESTDTLKVELYSTGQAVMAFEITDSSVCMSLLECMDKQTFNHTILSQYYPDDLIGSIFKSKPIFKGENMKNVHNGFTQSIRKANKYDIRYSVLTKQVVFSDIINNIVIKIKRM